MDLDTASSSYGENAGGFIAALREVNREKVDYAAFLRRFAVLGENIQVNDDEFDYIFYTYGMKLYGKMPLIEPLEYKEVKLVREFVVALDTSESVAGSLVQSFVTKTWNILKQTESFFTKVNIHILQCGARVEEDAKIRDQDEFDATCSTWCCAASAAPTSTRVRARGRAHKAARVCESQGPHLFHRRLRYLPGRAAGSMRRLSCSWTRDGNCPTCRPGR